MTPAARAQAAAELLDRILEGAAAEQALTGWARSSRFAGSSDRAAVRDLVFDALRCRRSFAALGGAETGRGLILGGLLQRGEPPEQIFTGVGHAPSPLSDAEKAHAENRLEFDPEVALDVPDWLAPALRESLGPDYAPVMARLRTRAPVFLRVNLRRARVAEAVEALARDGITAEPHPLAATALEVTGNARRVQNGAAYRDGLVELQDAASQAVVALLPLSAGARVLDYCAGGGGKSLAMAGQAEVEILAHDADPGRMRDLPARAERAGARIAIVSAQAARRQAPYDLVLADVPCSGSGSWRRAPEAKWRLTADRLAELCAIQAGILEEVAPLVRPGGHLAYVTCSLLAAENGDQVSRFLATRPGWRQVATRRLTPLDGGDGFFCAVLRRETA